MSTIKAENIAKGANSTNMDNAIFGSAKAWVYFNGQGTVAILNSYNVSSITDEGIGDYAVNFTTAMPNTNYALLGMAGETDTASDGARWVTDGAGTTYSNQTRTTSSVSIHTVFATSSFSDCDRVSIAVLTT